MKRRIVLVLTLVCLYHSAMAVDANRLFDSLRTKVLAVKDYTADVKMKIDIAYMRIPQLTGTLYFKSPDKMKLERHGGLSILPKKNINLTLSNLIPTGAVNVIDAGVDVVNGKKVRIVKVIPDDDRSDIVLTKLWIDEQDLLALRTETTTRNDGTVIMALQYEHYMRYALPDNVTITMYLKDYKLPKGVTMDYNDMPDMKPKKEGKHQKGTIQIHYLNYTINKGISDGIFKETKQ